MMFQMENGLIEGQDMCGAITGIPFLHGGKYASIQLLIVVYKRKTTCFRVESIGFFVNVYLLTIKVHIMPLITTIELRDEAG